MKLNVKAFGITCGLLWGLSLFIATWWVILLEGASGAPTIVGHFYRGYTVSATGSFIGLIWALVDGWVCGLIFASVYNWFAGKGSATQA